MIIIIAINLFVFKVLDINELNYVLSDKMLAFMILFAFFALTSVAVYIYGLANAFKRISDNAKERFLLRKTTSAIGLPSQNRDQNQFDFLR